MNGQQPKPQVVTSDGAQLPAQTQAQVAIGQSRPAVTQQSA
jgi:hypothetical protein